MPQGFNQLAYLPQHADKAITRIGLDEYLAQPIVKAQYGRAYELLKTLEKIGQDSATAKLTNLKGDEVHVIITPDIISEITKLPRGEPIVRQGYSDKELGETLVPFKGLKEVRIEQLMRLLHQNLHFERQTRYTRPDRNLASTLHKYIRQTK